MALNSTVLDVLPDLIEVLEEEVRNAVRICLADKCVKEYLEVFYRSFGEAVGQVSFVFRVLT